MSIAASTKSDPATIRVALQNVGHEQRLVDLGWLSDGTADPTHLELFVTWNDGASISIAKPTMVPTRPDPAAIPLPPGGRCEFTLSLDKYQMFSGDRRIPVSKYLSGQCGDRCGIQVQLRVRTPYCRDAGSVTPEASGCWKGTLIANDLRFPQ